MRSFLRILAIALFWYASMMLPSVADDDSDAHAQEYKIKIAFIYNFIKFIDWPGDNAPKKINAATICIMGDRDFSDYFSNFASSHPQALKVSVTSSVSAANINACNVLFIGKGEEENAPSILSYARKHPVLTISEAQNFADNGGIIEFVRVGKTVGLFSKDKLNLRINLKAAEAEHFNIDARLLQIAAEVIR